MKMTVFQHEYTGGAIPEDLLPEIFDPILQNEKIVKGTGLEY